jgi:D-alanyl-D-alanine carboxypeptidase
VAFPDGSLWSGTGGISHDTVSVALDMVLAVGSVTKNATATLVLRLVEEQILSLDDSVSQWLQSYPHVDGSTTIRQLLNHTSGIDNFFGNDEAWDALKEDRSRIWEPEEVLSLIKEPYFEPGEGWRYSNTNYLLVGMIVEMATGRQLAEVMQEYLWEPHGITSAFLSTGDSLPENMVHVYGDNFEPGSGERDLTFFPRASHESMIFGAGGLFMTAGDLALWCHQLFEGHVLAESSMAEMLQFVDFRPVSNMRAYGLGVQLFKREISSGKKAIGHAGGNIGSTTYMVYLPDYHLSVVVMVNAFPTGSADVITKGVIRTILRHEGALGPLPYVPFFPYGVIAICAAIWWLGVFFFHRKRKRALSAERPLAESGPARIPG